MGGAVHRLGPSSASLFTTSMRMRGLLFGHQNGISERARVVVCGHGSGALELERTRVFFEAAWRVSQRRRQQRLQVAPPPNLSPPTL